MTSTPWDNDDQFASDDDDDDDNDDGQRIEVPPPHLLAQLTLLQEHLQLIIDGSTCCRIPFHLELKERTWNLGIYKDIQADKFSTKTWI